MQPITIDRLARSKNVRFEFFRASGPGGQNVNKVATAVRLRFDLSADGVLPGDVRERLVRLAGSRMAEGGELIIEAKRFRTMERNRRDALNRLAVLIRRAWEKPKKRRRTRPGPAARRRRLENKRRRSLIKQKRGGVDRDSW